MNHEQARPREAQQLLSSVQARHPAIAMELVWEEESYDRSVHCDVLLQPSDGATVSLSYCLDHALPWPLRGVRRWSDADLVQVNGEVLKIQQAVDLLDIVWNEAPIMKRMIDVCLVREELGRRPIELDDDDLQLAVDGLRRTHKLYTAEATLRWMEQRGLTHDQLEQIAADNFTIARLRDRIAEGRIERTFEAHRAGLETAQIAQLTCTDEASARQLHRDIRAGELDLYEAAQQAFLAGQPHGCLRFATLRRPDTEGALGDAIFAAAPGDVIGPVPVDGGHGIARVLARTPARLDEATRAAIAELLFEDWLEERRRAARITWYWGTADREIPDLAALAAGTGS